MSKTAGGLGRVEPPDWNHVDKYPLLALPPRARPVLAPVVIGVNWYVEFDRPQKDSQGYWWVARDGKLTTVRGGHCVCLRPASVSDPASWWSWYNQGEEGICVGEGVSRGASLVNRVRYQPRWLYDRCKERDGDPTGEGTYVRTGLEVLRDLGHVKAKPREAENLTPRALDGRTPDPAAGITAFRWATDVQDVLRVLGFAGRDYVELINSWGRDYPHVVRMPAAVLDTLRREEGELGIPTDR